MKELNESEKAIVEQINALISTAKTSWFALLSYLAFVGVTLMGVEDADFFIPSRQTELPLIGVSVPTETFFYVAPALGTAIYAYFHLHLMKLWEPLAEAPDQLGGSHISDRIAPWLIADYALSKRLNSTPQTYLRLSRPLAKLSHSVSLTLAFLAGPMMLLWFWYTSLPKHDTSLTVVFVGVPLLTTIFIGKRSSEHLISLMTFRKPLFTFGPKPWVISCSLVAVLGLFGTKGIGDFFPFLSPLDRKLNLPVSANFKDVNFSQFPQKWTNYSSAKQTFVSQQCRLLELPEIACNVSIEVLSKPLPLAQNIQNKWCEKNDFDSDSCEATIQEVLESVSASWLNEYQEELTRKNQIDFSDTDLRNANFAYANLKGANFVDAQLEYANFSNSILEGVDFTGANIADAEFYGTRIEASILRGVDLMRANFTGASLHDSDFSTSDLEMAILNNVLSSSSNFRHAQLQETQLTNAVFSSGDFTSTNLKYSKILGTLFLNSDLSFASFDGSCYEPPSKFWSVDERYTLFNQNGLSQTQLNQVFGSRSAMPRPKLKRPSHWIKPGTKYNDFLIECKKWQDRNGEN